MVIQRDEEAQLEHDGHGKENGDKALHVQQLFAQQVHAEYVYACSDSESVQYAYGIRARLRRGNKQ